MTQGNPSQQPNRLARLRRASKRRMADLAVLCEVDVRTYRAWEEGSVQVPELQRALLAHLYGVSTAHLMGTATDRDNGQD